MHVHIFQVEYHTLDAVEYHILDAVEYILHMNVHPGLMILVAC